jgi:RNA polymerase sigma-70 factor (ECF subfamily)
MESHKSSILLESLDPQAVSGVFDCYYPHIFRFARYRLGDEILAEDISNEVFVRLLEAIKARRGPNKNLRGWLFSTASHLVTDHIRCHYRSQSQPLDETIPGSLPTPGDCLEYGEELALLNQGLKTLTVEQQNVLALRFGAGYSIEETSAVMKKKVNAIKQLQLRALSSLKRAMGQNL